MLKDTQTQHKKLGCRPHPAYIPQSFYDIHTEEGAAQALHQVQQRQDSSINIKTPPGCGKDMDTDEAQPHKHQLSANLFDGDDKPNRSTSPSRLRIPKELRLFSCAMLAGLMWIGD